MPMNAAADSADAPSALPAKTAIDRSVPGDRWMEIDLYWFDQKDIAGSASSFWNRFQPLYEGVTGYRGTLLNVGWTVGAVMEWSGTLAQAISLPKGTGQAKWVSEQAQLTGTTQERMRKADARFAEAAAVPRQPYDPWTYGDLQKVAAALRAEGGRRGIAAFKVGMFNLAWKGAYGEDAPWASRHPEAFSGVFNPANLLHADTDVLGGFPGGIPEGTPVHEAYAAQWGSLSKAVGLDAIMLRDSFGIPSPYGRPGLASSPDSIQRATAANCALIREVKQANPAALVMMYSSGASAVADWRCDGLDLESLASEGYLDIFVDQTWAGAWNEVGLRQGNFWNRPSLGWTYQLANMLVHSAILAKTSVRHYPLIETFDAWEDWDVIHTAPERLRWGMWAYSHAAVKTPQGLKFPAGSYISWANQGKRLLSGDDVSFLASNLNATISDVRQITEVYGPTAVYARSAMKLQADHASPNRDIKEWIDEQVGSIIKWPLPILSITRVEWLPQVASDLFILQTPSHLEPAELSAIKGLMQNGQALAIFGSNGDGIDPQLSVWDSAPATTPRAELVGQLVGPNLVMWEPPDFRYDGGSLAQIWNSDGSAYSRTAAALNALLAAHNCLHAVTMDWNQTMNVTAWRNRDGSNRIMAANLEEGLRDDGDFSRRCELVVPSTWHASKWRNYWGNIILSTGKAGKLTLNLSQASSVLLVSSAV
jgi:hypothetical protein